MRRDLGSFVLVVLLLGVSSLARGNEDIRLQGSAIAANALRAALTAGFTARFGDVRLSWQSAGSGAAFVALFSGDADIGVVSRRVQRDELELARRLGLELRESILALDGLAVVVHPRNRVPSLSLDQLEALYAGRIIGWVGVGGIDEAVRPLSTAESSGAPTEFRELVFSDPSSPFVASIEYLESSEAVIERVASDRGAIGFVSMSYDRARVRTVPLETSPEVVLLPTPASVSEATYPLRYPLRLYTVADPDDELGHFLRFLYLHDGPAIVADAGLVPVQAFASVMRTALQPRTRADVFCARIGFGFRGSRLNAAARQSLAELALRLASTDEGVWITGHQEPIEARRGLAAARAQSVLAYLEQRNIDPSRMMVDDRGTSEPIASNADLEGRRLNRRADVWILPP